MAWKVTASLEGVSAASIALNLALSLMGSGTAHLEPRNRTCSGAGGRKERWGERRRRTSSGNEGRWLPQAHREVTQGSPSWNLPPKTAEYEAGQVPPQEMLRG